MPFLTTHSCHSLPFTHVIPSVAEESQPHALNSPQNRNPFPSATQLTNSPENATAPVNMV